MIFVGTETREMIRYQNIYLKFACRYQTSFNFDKTHRFYPFVAILFLFFNLRRVGRIQKCSFKDSKMCWRLQSYAACVYGEIKIMLPIIFLPRIVVVVTIEWHAYLI